MVERKMEEEKLEGMIKGTNNANRSHLPAPDIGDLRNRNRKKGCLGNSEFALVLKSVRVDES